MNLRRALVWSGVAFGALAVIVLVSAFATGRLAVHFKREERRDFLERPWLGFKRELLALPQHPDCKDVPATLELPGLLQGYCQFSKSGAFLDVATYGEGKRALTRLEANLQGALDPSDVDNWAQAVSTAFRESKVRRSAAAWLVETARKRGGSKTISGQDVVVLVAPNYLRALITGGEDQPAGPSVSPFVGVPDRAIARRYAPVLHFDRQEKFFPISVNAYLTQTRLCRFRKVGQSRLETEDCVGLPKPGQRALPSACSNGQQGCYLALDILEAQEDLDPNDHIMADRRMRASFPAWTVYWHVVDPSPTRLLVEYWLFYSFNDFSHNKHEGDWESVVVELRPDTSAPTPIATRVAYSHHDKYENRRLDPSQGSFSGTWRPVVFVGRGSHANYFETGSPPVEVCGRVEHVKGCLAAPDKVDGAGQTLLPPDVGRPECRYSLAVLRGKAPPWRYGGGNYVYRQPLPRIVRGAGPTDPRTRDEWERTPLDIFEGRGSKKGVHPFDRSGVLCE